MVRGQVNFEDYLERLDKTIVKENYNVGLGFKEGYIFFRVERRELFPLLYDPFTEITNFAGVGTVDMSPLQYIAAKELPSTTLATTDIFKVDDPNHIYQLFYGISPSVCRIFLAYPRETEINQLDEGLHSSAYPIFGYIDGFESPLNRPGPRSQVFVPMGPLLGFAFYNYAPYNIKPLLRFIVNRLAVDTIRDVDLIDRILKRKVECTFAPVGGIASPWGTSTEIYMKQWKVTPVSLLATKTEIAAAVGGIS